MPGVVGVVMAGGQGERLQPLTFTTRKPFLPVAGKPCIAWGLGSLARGGVREVVVTTTYTDQELAPLGDGARFEVSLKVSHEESPLGTAGGVRRALDAGLLGDADTVLVMSGDVVADVDVAALLRAHQRAEAAATMALTEVEDPRPFGIVGQDERGFITRFLEKPQDAEIFSHRVNAGIYCLRREALEAVPRGRPFDFSKDLYPLLLREGKPLFGWPLEGYWRDIGRPEDLLAANLELSARIGTRTYGRVAIEPGAVVEGSCAYDAVRVEHGAVVRGSVLLEGARVGRDAVVEDSVLGRLASVGPRARVTRCVLGEEELVEAGSRLADEKRPAPTQQAQARGA